MFHCTSKGELYNLSNGLLLCVTELINLNVKPVESFVFFVFVCHCVYRGKRDLLPMKCFVFMSYRTNKATCDTSELICISCVCVTSCVQRGKRGCAHQTQLYRRHNTTGPSSGCTLFTDWGSLILTLS